jgi:hypothetical protein
VVKFCDVSNRRTKFCGLVKNSSELFERQRRCVGTDSWKVRQLVVRYDVTENLLVFVLISVVVLVFVLACDQFPKRARIRTEYTRQSRKS